MRIGTVYPDREAYRDPSIQPFFFFVRAEEFQLGIVANMILLLFLFGEKK